MMPWSEVASRLVAIAAGRAPADLVIRGGRLVNVQSREILDGWQVAIAEGRFAYVGPDAGHCIGEETEVVEADGVTILIDPKATMFILGTEMDYVEDKLESGFVFRNPNEKGRCGCGESFHI